MYVRVWNSQMNSSYIWYFGIFMFWISFELNCNWILYVCFSKKKIKPFIEGLMSCEWKYKMTATENITIAYVCCFCSTKPQRWMWFVASMTLCQVVTGVLFAQTFQQHARNSHVLNHNKIPIRAAQTYAYAYAYAHMHTLQNASKSRITFQYTQLFIMINICLSNIVFV